MSEYSEFNFKYSKEFGFFVSTSYGMETKTNIIKQKRKGKHYGEEGALCVMKMRRTVHAKKSNTLRHDNQCYGMHTRTQQYPKIAVFSFLEIN